MKRLFLLFFCLALLPIVFTIGLPVVYGYNASSASYTIGSFEQGIAGGNSNSTSFNMSSTSSYQTGGQLLSYHYFGITGFLDLTNTAPSSVCGNGLVESGESCDNGAASNGACPNSCSSYCTVNSCSSGGGSSGGSGSSGGGSGEYLGFIPSVQDTSSNASKSYTVSRIYDVLPSGTNNIEIDMPQIPFYEIVLNTNADSKNAQLEITNMDTVPNSYNFSKVNGYVEISHTNIDNSNIVNVKIHFKVDTLWLSNNGLSKESIVLLRYNTFTNSWDELPTRPIGSSANYTYIYYESISPGLSLFAISTKTIQTPTPVISNVVNTNPVNNNVNENNPNTAAVSGNQPSGKNTNTKYNPLNWNTIISNLSESSKTIITISGIVLLIIILLSVIVHKARTGKTRPGIVQGNSSNMTQANPSTELRIEEWMFKEELLGYNKEKLRQALLNKGHNPKDVDEALRNVDNKLSNTPHPLHPQLELQLEQWILEKEPLGYNREQLKQFLLNKGYDPKDVEVAIMNAKKK